MDEFTLTRYIIAIAFLIILAIYVLVKLFYKKNPITINFLTRTGVFAAFSTILYIVPGLKFAVPFFPSFLELHFDEIPSLIAGFAYGPLSGFFIILIKSIIKLPFTTTLGVGELADFIYSTFFIIPASCIYKKNRHIKGAIKGLTVGTLFQLLVSSFITSFAILNFYIFIMGFSKDTIINMCHVINPAINSLGWPFLLMVALPFNLFKDLIVIIITFLLYKKIHRWLDKIAQKN